MDTTVKLFIRLTPGDLDFKVLAFGNRLKFARRCWQRLLREAKESGLIDWSYSKQVGYKKRWEIPFPIRPYPGDAACYQELRVRW